MDRKSLGGLIALNLALLAALAVFSFTEPVEAQRARAGDYIMIAGQSPGKQEATIYVADLNNAALMAISYSQGNKRLDAVGIRDLSGDFPADRKAR